LIEINRGVSIHWSILLFSNKRGGVTFLRKWNIAKLSRAIYNPINKVVIRNFISVYIEKYFYLECREDTCIFRIEIQCSLIFCWIVKKVFANHKPFLTCWNTVCCSNKNFVYFEFVSERVGRKYMLNCFDAQFTWFRTKYIYDLYM
jgi:hypothetical protein